MAGFGMTTKDLMARGGHSTPQAALRYQHAARDRQREAVDKLGALIAFQPRDVRAIETKNAPRSGARRRRKLDYSGFMLASTAGIEPATYRLGGGCSIR
jgi:hypothetical protein